MSEFSKHVGHIIKKCRKSKKITIEELGERINKSKATVSKYENGSVPMDLDTLYEISQTLDIDIMSLVDYNAAKKQQIVTNTNTYFGFSKIYMYYYDGRTSEIVKTLILQVPNEEATSDDNTKVIVYQGVASFADPEKCQHVFVGEMVPYDTITHFNLTNQVNKTEQLYICIFNPLHANSPGIGMLSGIASNPFFGPIAIKVLISKDELEEDEALMKVIKLQKLEHDIFENLNMMAINRPNSLFLTKKEKSEPSTVL